MLKNVILASCVLAASATVASSQELNNFYAGVGVGAINYDEAGQSFSSTTLHLLGGYQFSGNFSVEAETSIVASGDTASIEGSSVDVDLSHMGIYARLNLLDGAETFVPYVRAGYVRGKVEVKAAGVSISDTTTGFSYGIGGEYRYSDKGSIRVDFGAADFDNSDATLLAITNTWRF